jgi:hypothetical protein
LVLTGGLGFARPCSNQIPQKVRHRVVDQLPAKFGQEFRNPFSVMTSGQVIVEVAQDIREKRSIVDASGISFKVA